MARPRNPRLARWAKNDRTSSRKGGPRTWSRAVGMLLCLTSLAALYVVYARHDFSFEAHWPVLGFGALITMLGWICLRARLA